MSLLTGRAGRSGPPAAGAAARPADGRTRVAALVPLALLLSTAAAHAAPSPPGRACAGCHPEIVARYQRHGMASSVAPVGAPPPGEVANPTSGNRYQVVANEDGAWLLGKLPDGGFRRQRLVGRIGAGRLDTSWAAAEVDVYSGQETGRLFFAPVELLTSDGWTLAPFELHDGSPGLDMALTADCLTCHVDQELSRLPGAAVAERSGERSLFPPNALGADAFAALRGIGCETCHGDAGEHRERMADPARPATGGLAIADLGARSAAEQIDICARCHLQGDVRIELVGPRPARDRPLAGQTPVLVTARGGDDFRFVSQVERLALSRCFRGSPAMTCTTCHDPHAGVATQGIDSFDQACERCHAGRCSRPAGLTVAAVTGASARSTAGCVDCHLRRSRPFDLPDVAAADHFIRRAIPRPAARMAHRPYADPGGSPELFGGDRLAALETAAGRRWRSGVEAIALASLGRLEEAAARFDEFPAPGSPVARRPTAPAGLEPLESQPLFHETRALVLLARRRLDEADRAYSDALALDPLSASAFLGRAQLRLARGDVQGVLDDTGKVVELYPAAEQPWDLRILLAERVGRADLVLAALAESTRRWPSNPRNWAKLAVLARQRGLAVEAQEALERVERLQPSLEVPGLPHR